MRIKEIGAAPCPIIREACHTSWASAQTRWARIRGVGEREYRGRSLVRTMIGVLEFSTSSDWTKVTGLGVSSSSSEYYCTDHSLGLNNKQIPAACGVRALKCGYNTYTFQERLFFL